MTSSNSGAASAWRVLFVPDGLLTGELRSSFLDRGAFLVRTASDAETALSMAELFRPSLVVISSEFCGTRIAELCMQLQAVTTPRPKLVLLTEQLGDALWGTEQAPRDCHLISPVDTAQLLDTIATLLEVSRRRSPRALLEALVHTKGFGSTAVDMPGLGNSIDVSEDGMLLECSRQLDMRAEGFVDFFLPGESQRLSVKGVVKLAVDEVRLHYAIEWTDIAPDTRSSIRRYVHECGAV